MPSIGYCHLYTLQDGLVTVLAFKFKFLAAGIFLAVSRFVTKKPGRSLSPLITPPIYQTTLYIGLPRLLKN